WSTLVQGMSAWSNLFVEASGSREDLKKVFVSNVRRIVSDPNGNPVDGLEAHIAVFMDDKHLVGVGDGESAEKAAAMRTSLANAERRAVTPRGDTLAAGGGHALLTFAPAPGLPAMEVVARTTFDPMPDYYVSAWMNALR